MYRASVNQKKFEIISNENELTVDGKSMPWDLVKVGDGYFHILINTKSYRAEIVKVNRSTKSFLIKINGEQYFIELKDKFDLLLEKMGLTNGIGGKINSIKAPMPGLIIDLKVKAGDKVMAGDSLLILEAMKMENLIKASGESTVKSVKVKKGDSVEKNQILIEF
jgi:biotin carboxyl carrier protein